MTVILNRWLAASGWYLLGADPLNKILTRQELHLALAAPRLKQRPVPVALCRVVKRPSGKNNRIYHTQKGMKSPQKGMKNHYLSRKILFHTLLGCFIPISILLDLVWLFHALCYYFIRCATTSSYFVFFFILRVQSSNLDFLFHTWNPFSYHCPFFIP